MKRFLLRQLGVQRSVLLLVRAFLSDRRPAGLKGRTLLLRLAAGCALLTLLVGPTAGTPAYAATFTVNSTGDEPDSIRGNGRCLTRVGTCTLRAAIQEANALAGKDIIAFKIPGLGPHTISPAPALPDITGPVVVDATTQPGFEGTPIVELNGAFAGLGANGLTITGSSSTVRGLVIRSFTGAGIVLSGSGRSVIQGNFIGTGTDISETVVQGNLTGVVILQSPNNLIGGTEAGARNLISGNREDGVLISGSGATATGCRATSSAPTSPAP